MNQRCPKCESDTPMTPKYGYVQPEPRLAYGGTSFGPEYVRPPRKEWLEWTCSRCGYRMETPPADAPKPKKSENSA